MKFFEANGETAFARHIELIDQDDARAARREGMEMVDISLVEFGDTLVEGAGMVKKRGGFLATQRKIRREKPEGVGATPPFTLPSQPSGIAKVEAELVD
ncbi:MAG: hypothetical protein H0X27_05300 [Caulobacteraceae bacterium]|nr:hypothetical protein [Caulobacteraceae bacterium]